MKNFIFALSTILLIISGCSSCKVDKNKEIKNDKVVMKNLANNKSLSQGTVVILGIVKSFNEDKCEIYISEILGYGPSTKPIAPGLTIKVKSKVNLFTNKNFNIKELINNRQILKIKLHQTDRALNNPQNIWEMLSVNSIH